MDLRIFNETVVNNGLSPLQFNEIAFPDDEYEKKVSKKKTFVLHDSAGWDNARNMFHSWDADKKGKVAAAYGIQDDGSIFRGFDASKYFGYALYVNHNDNHLPASLQQYKTRQQDIFLNSQAVQVEVCNWGWLRDVGTKITSYTGVGIPKERTVFYPAAFRGLHYFERITDHEIAALRILMFYHAIVDDLRLIYNPDMWNVSERALRGAEGIWAHVSYRTDKLDIHPQPELVEMLKKAESDFNAIFHRDLIVTIKSKEK